jgi:hypothetical protein
MACWAFYIKEAGLSVWDCFKKMGIPNKTISQFRRHWEEGLSNYQRKAWVEYDKLYSLEIRYVISKMV